MPEQEETIARGVARSGNVIRFARGTNNPWHFISLNEPAVNDPVDLSNKPPSAKNPNAKRDKALHARTVGILDEIENESQRAFVDEPQGRKEREYRNMLAENARALRDVVEVTDTDQPIYMGHLDRRVLLALSDNNGRVKRSDENRYGVRVWCNKCTAETPAEYSFLWCGDPYCALCTPTGDQCNSCGGVYECAAVPQVDGSAKLLCPLCEKNGSSCRRCGSPIPSNQVSLGHCDSCMNTLGSSGMERSFNLGMSQVGKTPGKIVQSLRIFSCEIETGVDASQKRIDIVSLLPQEAGIAHDGSVKLTNAFEVQTPKLAGAQGEAFVEKICDALKVCGGRINETCGLHIHLDGRGLIPLSRKEYPIELLQLWKAYLVFEDVILSFLPFSRRRNDFCRPIGEAFKFIELDSLRSMLDAEKLWYSQRGFRSVASAKGTHRHPTRYFGVNLHSLLADGHLEIRYHSGTLKAQKILEWTNLHVLIMDAAQKHVFNNDFLYEAQHTSSLKEKTEMLFERIGLSASSIEHFRGRQQKFMSKSQNDNQ